MSDDSINLRPLELDWRDWTSRYADLHARRHLTPKTPHALVHLITTWTDEMIAWYDALTLNAQDDLTMLLDAEIDMLWACVDPPDGMQPSEDDRLDFRERFFGAQTLTTLLERRVPRRAQQVRRRLHDLEVFATTKRGWLP